MKLLGKKWLKMPTCSTKVNQKPIAQATKNGSCSFFNILITNKAMDVIKQQKEKIGRVK